MTRGDVMRSIVSVLRATPWLDCHEIKAAVPGSCPRTLWRMVHSGKRRPALLRRRPGAGKFARYQYAVIV